MPSGDRSSGSPGFGRVGDKSKERMSENDQDRRLKARQKAQNHFTAAEQRDAGIKKQLEADRAHSAAKTARLRALRLAKEAADGEAESKATTEASQPAPQRSKRSVRRITPA
jgi:hypothetical protein